MSSDTKISLPSLTTTENGYNTGIMVYNSTRNVFINSADSLIDGGAEKLCGINSGFRLIACTEGVMEWSSVGTGLVNTKLFIKTAESNPNLQPLSTKTIDLKLSDLNDNDVLIVRGNNYFRPGPANQYEPENTDTYCWQPGYTIKLITDNFLYPGFRFTVVNLSPNMRATVNQLNNYNLQISACNNGQLNARPNFSIIVGPWYASAGPWNGHGGTNPGYGQALCATFMYDGDNWWTVRA